MKQLYLIALAALLLSSLNTMAAPQEQDSDLMKADSNKDGKVSFDEYKAAHEARLRARFERKDINKDGYIDLEEKQVAKEKKQEQRKVKKAVEQRELREKYVEERQKRKKHFYKY